MRKLGTLTCSAGMSANNTRTNGGNVGATGVFRIGPATKSFRLLTALNDCFFVMQPDPAANASPATPNTPNPSGLSCSATTGFPLVANTPSVENSPGWGCDTVIAIFSATGGTVDVFADLAT